MPQEADMGITNMAMSTSANPRYQGDEFLLVKFFLHPRLNTTKSAELGRPIYEEQPYIQIMQPGNKDSIVQRPASEMDKNRFAEHWRKYQSRETNEGVTGTLLEEWPGVTRSQCEELKYLNIRTVEQLANISDSNAQNIMGISLLKQKAAKYLEASKDEATVNALNSANAEIDMLKSQMQQILAEKRDEPTADLESLDEEPAAKPKRKRRTNAGIEADNTKLAAEE